MSKTPAELKAEILRLSREYSALMHQGNRPGYKPDGGARPKFVPGQTVVPYAGRVFSEDEVEAAVNATLDFWLTLGPEGEAFEMINHNALHTLESGIIRRLDAQHKPVR